MLRVRLLATLLAGSAPVAVVASWHPRVTVTEREVHRVVDTQEWEGLWERIAPGKTPPEVDFENSLVVVVAEPPSAVSASLAFDAAEQTDKELVVTFRTYTGDAPPRIPKKGSSAMVALPRTERPVRVQVRAASMREPNSPPTTIKVFPPLE